MMLEFDKENEYFCKTMRRFLKYFAIVSAGILAMAAASTDLSAQNRRDQSGNRRKSQTATRRTSSAKEIEPLQQTYRSDGGVFEYIIEGNDTIYIDKIRASKVYPRLARQRGKDWRKYYRLVYNFNKTYPYALVARELLTEVDSTLIADDLKKGKREKYLKEKQNELFHYFETPLKNMTVSQGRILMRLIDREVGKSSFSIIKEYRNGIAAGFWQGMAKLFGSDLKRHYDPVNDDEDAQIEDLVEKWEEGSFDAFYFSVFMEPPTKVILPDQYRDKANL